MNRSSLVLFAMVAFAGCGGGSVGTPTPAPAPTTPTAATANIQGQWQIIAQSTTGGTGTLVEANFTQNGSNVQAAKSSVVLIAGQPGSYLGLGGECDNSVLVDDSIQGSVTGQTVSLTLTESGSLGTGTSTGTATISSDGTQITSGTYTTPAACGFVADSGTITGAIIKPFAGTFAGILANESGTDAVTVTISQSNFNLSVTGTDTGTPFTLSGTVVGATFHVTGTIAGRSVEYVGLYETSANDFRVYDTSFNSLGVLNVQSSAPSPTPISVSVFPSTASVQTGQPANFAATVMNDNANKGVTWALSGSGCSGTTCGSIAPTSSSSGATVVYTAPTAVPSGTIALTATSVSDSTKSAGATITITTGPSITVSVSPTTANLTTGGVTQMFTATVQNDSQNKGVTWTLSGANCSGASCGTVSPASSVSAAAVTYTSPASPSSVGTVILTATSVSSNPVSAVATITLTAPAATGPVNLGVGSAPSTVVDSNGVIDIAWVSQAGIVFARSSDNGVTVSSPNLVVPGSSGPVSIQVDAQNDIVIFTGEMLARSTDGGKTFSNVAMQQQTHALLLVQPSGVLDLVYTASDDNGVDPDNSVHESRSTDGGKTFVNDQLLWSAGINSNDVLELRGAVGQQGQIYLTWAEQSDLSCEVYFIASLDGVNFQPVITLSHTDVCNINPMLVVDAGGNVNLTWEDGTFEFVRSTDQGQMFTTPSSGPPVEITRFTQEFVVGPNGEIVVVFDELLTSGIDQIFFTQSLDHGVTWSTPLNLSLPNPVQNFTGATDPSVGVDASGKITVAWEDDTNGTFSGDNDIYIRTSTDGVTFSNPMDVSNTTDQIEVNPTVLEAPDGKRYMTWYDMNGQQSDPVLSVFFYAAQ